MKKHRPEWYLNRPYRWAHYPEEEGGYFAEIEEFPGCHAQGDSVEETLKNLREIALDWLALAIEQGLEIPEPLELREEKEYKGKVALRIPKSLHRRAVKMAELDGVSLNQYLTIAISSMVTAEDLSVRFLKMPNFSRSISTTLNINLIQQFPLGNIPFSIESMQRAEVLASP